MIRSIKDIRGVTEPETLLKMEAQFDDDIHTSLRELVVLLNQNIMTLDPTGLMRHMNTVESWRERVVILFSLSTAFVEHAKGVTFMVKKDKGVTDTDRESTRRHLSAGFTAECVFLEGTIKCVDSRVNLCKKLLGMEDSGVRNANVRNAA